MQLLKAHYFSRDVPSIFAASIQSSWQCQLACRNNGRVVQSQPLGCPPSALCHTTLSLSAPDSASMNANLTSQYLKPPDTSSHILPPNSTLARARRKSYINFITSVLFFLLDMWHLLSNLNQETDLYFFFFSLKHKTSVHFFFIISSC